MKRQAAEPSSAEKKEPEDYHFFGHHLKTYESHGKANHSSRVGAVGKALPVWKQVGSCLLSTLFLLSPGGRWSIMISCFAGSDGSSGEKKVSWGV